MYRLFVGGFRRDVVLNAVLAERVQAGERLGVLVALEADLADEKFVVNFLRQLRSRRRRHFELVLLLLLLLGGDVRTQTTTDSLHACAAKRKQFP